MLKDYLKEAKNEGWAIPQFNFSTLEQLRTIKEVSQKLKSPVIVATSEGEAKFFGFNEAVAVIKRYQEQGIKIYLNLDHGSSFESCKYAIDVGYDAIHFDGSKLDFIENQKITKKVAEYAKKINSTISVEGELGIIGDADSFDRGINAKPTNIEEIESFVSKTKVDRLAVSIGTVHGISAKEQKIDFSILKEIGQKTQIGLVLHGGSGVNNKDIKSAIKYGITKININTELRIAFTEGLREMLENNKKEIKPYNYYNKAIENTMKIAETKIILFGSNKRL